MLNKLANVTRIVKLHGQKTGIQTQKLHNTKMMHTDCVTQPPVASGPSQLRLSTD